MNRHILLLPICSLLLMNCGGGSHRTQTGDAGWDATADTGTQHDVQADVADTKPATDTHDGGTVTHDGSTVTDTASEQPGDAPVATYTVGGTVTGLSGSGLVLQNNLGDNLQT